MGPSMNESCIEACQACAEACERCATACLQEQDVAKMAECIRLDRDCADLCRQAVALMSRDSRFAADLCALVARACDACGVECAKHTAMRHCQECAEACKRCAEECRKMGRPAQPRSDATARA